VPWVNLHDQLAAAATGRQDPAILIDRHDGVDPAFARRDHRGHSAVFGALPDATAP